MENPGRNAGQQVAWFLIILALAPNAIRADTVIDSFTGTNGSNPYGVLVADNSGNLYGTTYTGGSGAGTVFELVAASGYSEEVLYSFTGGSDGGFPMAGLVIDPAGNLYGTVSCGGGSTVCVNGTGGAGLVFELTAASGHSSLEVLYHFTGGADGGNPVASLTLDSQMNLYGTTLQGGRGTCSAGCGVVFQLTAASGHQSENVLYAFTGSADGANPRAPVIFNTAETLLYGTTYQGGTGTCSGPATGCGVVFRVSLAGVETVLHRFTAATGTLPIAPVVFDQTGTILYGAASAGGKAACTGGCGTIYRLSGAALATFHVMHAFAKTDGANPTGGLALDPTTTYLVGTTFAGGLYNLGLIFQLEQSGPYSVIHSFAGAPTDGANPFAGLLLGIAPPAGGGTRDESTIPPPKGKGCPSRGCAGSSVSGGALNLGSVFSD